MNDTQKKKKKKNKKKTSRLETATDAALEVRPRNI